MFVHRGLRFVHPINQTTQKFSTQPAFKKFNPTQLYVVAGLASLGITLWYYNSPSVSTHRTDCPKVFDSEDWVDLRLASFEALSQNTKKLRFEFDDKAAVSGLQVASAVLASFKHEGNEKNIIRPYTPTSDENAQGYLDLVVKVYPGGLMSNHLHSMKVGQRLSLKGPIPKYRWEANKHNHICLIAGGTGITPMYQLARQVLNNPEDNTKVTLVFGNDTENDILLKKELQDLESTYPDRFRACYVLSNPSESWTGKKGRITKEILRGLLPDSRQENIKLFVCGPPDFYKSISGPKAGPSDQGELSGILKDLGYHQDQVFKF